MSAVVCDTSPINYLIRIGEIDLFPKLFGEILMPPRCFAGITGCGRALAGAGVGLQDPFVGESARSRHY